MKHGVDTRLLLKIFLATLCEVAVQVCKCVLLLLVRAKAVQLNRAVETNLLQIGLGGVL